MLRLHCIIHKGKNLLCKGETIMGLIEQSMIPLNKAKRGCYHCGTGKDYGSSYSGKDG